MNSCLLTKNLRSLPIILPLAIVDIAVLRECIWISVLKNSQYLKSDKFARCLGEPMFDELRVNRSIFVIPKSSRRVGRCKFSWWFINYFWSWMKDLLWIAIRKRPPVGNCLDTARVWYKWRYKEEEAQLSTQGVLMPLKKLPARYVMSEKAIRKHLQLYKDIILEQVLIRV